MEGLLRELAPQVLGALVRRYGQFDAAEDAVQEALLAASLQWPRDGVPDNPRAWLSSVASRRLVDEFRSESARRRREVERRRRWTPVEPRGRRDRDDTLTLLFLCCHPALSPPSQLALTLRAVGGLTTAEIAAAFLVPEATMAQRISRAKQAIRRSGRGFEPPPEAERAERLRVVRQVLYLIFNEGYTAVRRPGTAAGRADRGGDPARPGCCTRRRPATPRPAGLLALMLLTDARRPARTDPGRRAGAARRAGPRRCGTRSRSPRGSRWCRRTLGRGPLGPYQIQAAIAALHDEAPSDGETDWPQILALYEVLERLSPGPVVTLNRAVAVAARPAGRSPALAVLGDAGRRRADGRQPPARGRPRAPAGAGRRPRCRPGPRSWPRRS